MYFSTPVYLLLCKAGFILASILLDYCQRLYTHQLFSLPNVHPTKEIIPICLKKGDKRFQLGELSEKSLMWTENVRLTLYE